MQLEVTSSGEVVAKSRKHKPFDGKCVIMCGLQERQRFGVVTEEIVSGSDAPVHAGNRTRIICKAIIFFRLAIPIETGQRYTTFNKGFSKAGVDLPHHVGLGCL